MFPSIKAFLKPILGIGAALIFWSAAQSALGKAEEDANDVVVVVAASSKIDQLNPDQVSNIFLDKSLILSDGTVTAPTDEPERSPLRDRFYLALCGKSPAQMKAYWSRLIFTGRGKPPREAASAEAVKSFIRSTPGAIGYLSASDVDTTVKVVLHLR